MKQGRPFAVFDIDGTLIRWQLYHAVADELASLELLDTAAYQLACEARMLWKHRQGEEAFSDYEERLVDAVYASLQTLPLEPYHTAIERAFDTYKQQSYRYTRQLLEDLRKQGYLLFAVSASMDDMVGKIAEHYGFDDYAATHLDHDGVQFTGRATVVRSRAKPEHLRKLVAQHGGTYAGSIGIGDGEGDIDMLNAVENPIAFNPSKRLFAHAEAHGWKIVLERKNMIYELERTSQNATYTLVPQKVLA